MVPEIPAHALKPGPTGVRAQALAPDGTLVDDFVIEEGVQAVMVLNAPSPAATAAFPIGRSIADRVMSAL